jgi:ATPase subunit of ABC transporter with duplicated ATPase domains
MKKIMVLSRARKSYDGKVVLDDVKLAFLPGAKIGVVGPNGMVWVPTTYANRRYS